MTTVAYKGGIMAADSHVISSSRARVMGTFEKVFRLSDGTLFGVAGSVEWSCALRTWAVTGMNGKFPTYSRGAEESGVAISVSPKKPNVVIYYYSDAEMANATTFAMIPKFGVAIGSGEQYACGAMCNGDSAVTAVKVARKLDACTGGTILYAGFNGAFRKVA